MLDLLDRYGLPATFYVPGYTARLHPTGASIRLRLGCGPNPSMGQDGSDRGGAGRKPVFLFDMGGVVLRWRDGRQIYRHVARRFGLSAGAVEKALRPEIVRLQRGGGAVEECVARALGALGVGPAERGEEDGWSLLAAPFRERARLRNGVAGIVVGLRQKGFGVYALTNTIAPHLEVMREKGWTSLFDGFYASCELGAAKPEPQAYLTALRNMGAHPQQTVFVDDRQENVDGARRAGILWTIRYTSISTLKKQIAQALQAYNH